jgi:hypothetical protein
MPRTVPLALLLAVLSGGPGAPPVPAPRYTTRGALILPPGFETWVRVGSSIGLGYTSTDDSPPGMFHDVLLEPAAYAAYERTGRFPDHTQLALTMFVPEQRAPPALAGWYEGALGAVEMAVKDTSRFPGGWAYFGFGVGGPGSTAMPFPRESCAQCHAAHGAKDNVFLQFYPILRDIRR